MRIRKKSQRSSSLGPLLDDNQLLLSSNLAERSANTNSLESIDSNPRRAVAKNIPGQHHMTQHRDRETGAVPRRPLQAVASLGPDGQAGNVLMGSPPRLLNDFSRPLPPYLPLVMPGSTAGPPAAHPPHPPHIPLPGLTCQVTFLLNKTVSWDLNIGLFRIQCSNSNKSIDLSYLPKSRLFFQISKILGHF